MLLFYWYLYILLWFLAYMAKNMEIKQQNRVLAVYCGLWALVFGLRRYDVGNDTPSYVAYFENKGLGLGYGTVDFPFDTIEEGFWVLSKIINFFTGNATVVFLLFGVGIWYVIYKLYSSYSQTPLLSLFYMLTLTGTMFYTLQIAVRQAASIVVIGLGVLLIRKAGNTNFTNFWKNKYAFMGILLCLASITIHRTTGALVVILFVLYFVKFSKIVSYVLVLISTIIAIVFSDFLAQVFDGFLMLIDGASNENIALLGERYLGDMDANSFSKGSMIAWLFSTIITIHLTQKKDTGTFFYNIYIFTYVLHQFVQFSHMHLRLITLFLMMGYVVSVPSICVYKKNYYYLYLLMGLAFLVLDYGWLSNWNVKSDSALPYYFIWE